MKLGQYRCADDMATRAGIRAIHELEQMQKGTEM